MNDDAVGACEICGGFAHTKAPLVEVDPPEPLRTSSSRVRRRERAELEAKVGV